MTGVAERCGPRADRCRQVVTRAVLYALLAVSCAEKRELSDAVPAGPDAACALDGMLLATHDGPKGQILRRDGTRLYYCDTKETVAEWLDPVRRNRMKGMWFQTLEDGPWEAHVDGWAAADSLFFVVGSRRSGSMGPTLVPFRTSAAAEEFAQLHGGRIQRLWEIDAGTLQALRRQGMRQLEAAPRP